MDILPIAQFATMMTQSQIQMQAQVLLLKAAVNQQSAAALTLLEALPQNPPNLGGNVDLMI